MKELQSKKEWLNEQSKEQLIIFYKNNEYEIQRLRDKIALLTGCMGFGDCDGTNGGCIDCMFDNPHLHQRCHLFQQAFHQYRKEKREEAEKILTKQSPIKYGEWILRRWTTECDWGCINHRSVTCSACGTEFIDKEPTNYCPECGTKMKEKENKCK